MAPLGPVTRYEMVGYYWLDEMRHEYNSIGHVLRCAVARALGVER